MKMTKIAPKKILIIEDDEDILFTLKAFLETENYQVSTAENGASALELIKTDGVPNLILLDMKMPIMNGWEFAIEFVNKFDHLSPIVVMTAAEDAQKRARDISAIGWVGKPFDLNDLLKKIKTHIR